MTETEARDWIAAQFGTAAAADVGRLLDLILTENRIQNLIAPSTEASIWVRHALDSAQLLPLAPMSGLWVDVGTGAGFPGLVVALLRRLPTILVEPRTRRFQFLERATRILKLSHVEVVQAKVEKLSLDASVISARAVTSIEKILAMAGGCATMKTRWVLPRGVITDSDLAALRANWNGMFHVKRSVTDPSSVILVANGVSRR